MKFAITTPTGKIGSKLVNELLDRGGHDLVLLTRDQRKAHEASQRGATIFEGRLEQRDFFTRATAGVDALFLVLPINSRSTSLTQECNQIVDSAIEAIKANDIQRVVFVSSIGAHLAEGTGPIRYLRQAEQRLRDAVPNLTVLRPTFFMDQSLEWMRDIADNRAVFMPHSETTTVPMIATRDIADYSADVLADTRWSGSRVIPLHGPREYTFREVTDILGQTLGMELRHVELDAPEAAEKLRGRGWSEEAVNRNLEMHRSLALGNLVDEFPRSEWTVRPTTFEDFARLDFQPAFEKIAAVHA